MHVRCCFSGCIYRDTFKVKRVLEKVELEKVSKLRGKGSFAGLLFM